MYRVRNHSCIRNPVRQGGNEKPATHSKFRHNSSMHPDEACSDQPKDKHCVMGNAWFGSVQGAIALAKAGCRAVLQVKTSSSMFPKAFIDGALKDAWWHLHCSSSNH